MDKVKLRIQLSTPCIAMAGSTCYNKPTATHHQHGSDAWVLYILLTSRQECPSLDVGTHDRRNSPMSPPPQSLSPAHVRDTSGLSGYRRWCCRWRLWPLSRSAQRGATRLCRPRFSTPRSRAPCQTWWGLTVWYPQRALTLRHPSIRDGIEHGRTGLHV